MLKACQNHRVWQGLRGLCAPTLSANSGASFFTLEEVVVEKDSRGRNLDTSKQAPETR